MISFKKIIVLLYKVFELSPQWIPLCLTWLMFGLSTSTWLQQLPTESPPWLGARIPLRAWAECNLDILGSYQPCGRSTLGWTLSGPPLLKCKQESDHRCQVGSNLPCTLRAVADTPCGRSMLIRKLVCHHRCQVCSDLPCSLPVVVNTLSGPAMLTR